MFAQLGTKPSDVHIDRSSAAEIVGSPHFTEELISSKDSPWVSREEMEEFKLLVREIQRSAKHPGNEVGFINDNARGLDRGRGRIGIGSGLLKQAQTELDFRRARGRQEQVAHTPIERECRQGDLRQNHDAGGISCFDECEARSTRSSRVEAAIDQDRIESRGHRFRDSQGKRRGSDLVREQVESGKRIGRVSVREAKQQHLIAPFSR